MTARYIPSSTTKEVIADTQTWESTGEKPGIGSIERLAGKRVLVTGGGGFIGSNVVKTLASRADVTLLDNFTSGVRDNVTSVDRITVATGDIRDREFVDRVMSGQDILIHMAAMAGVQRTIDNPGDTLEVNVEGTRTVLKSALSAGVGHILFTSTSEMYGDLSEPPYQEDSPMAPKTNYAVAKAVNERYVRAYCRQADVPYTIVRYFNVYGPDQDGSTDGYVVPKFVRRALSEGTVPVYGSGEQTRDFTYIDDAIDATIRSLGPAGHNETFNVGTGRETSIRELAEIVTETLDSGDIDHVEDPRPYRVERRCADITKARIRLDYEPETLLPDGIQAVAESLARSNAELPTP